MRGFAGALAVLVALGCGSDIPGILDVDFESGGQLETGADASSGASTGEGSAGPGDRTGGGASSGTSSSTSASTGSDASTSGGTGGEGDDGGGGKVLPVRVEVFLSPSSATVVGEVQVSVSTSRPVTAIDLYDDGVPLVLGAAPSNPLHVFEVTSEAVPGDGVHTIRAVAHAADGVSGAGEKELLVDVQPGGTDVWQPYVQGGPINGFTGAVLLGNGVAAAGFLEVKQGLEAIAVRVDGTKGQPESAPILLGPIAFSGEGRGPAIAAGDDGAVFVASTRPAVGSTTWAVSKVRFGEPLPVKWTRTGVPGTVAHAVAVAGEIVIVAGAVQVKPGTHDLKVWWLAEADGDVLHEVTFAAPVEGDLLNVRDEVARGVAVVDGEVVVVGEREVKGEENKIYRRAAVLYADLGGSVIGEWTSPGGLLDEDGAMAVASLRAGGFVVTGWGRKQGTNVRQVVTRWFSAAGEPGPVRHEPTPTSDATGYAVGEDREGKIVVAGAIKRPGTDFDAWIFAVPGPLGMHTWDVFRDGPSHGPDEAAGLAVDAWGYSYVVGSEFEALLPRAFALRLYP